MMRFRDLLFKSTELLIDVIDMQPVAAENVRRAESSHHQH
jgi:hypothetical protein